MPYLVAVRPSNLAPVATFGPFRTVPEAKAVARRHQIDLVARQWGHIDVERTETLAERRAAGGLRFGSPEILSRYTATSTGVRRTR